MKTRHAQCALDPECFLLGPLSNVETACPGAVYFGAKWREERREKLVAYRHPFCARHALLIKRLGGALPQTKKAAAAAEPANVNTLGPPVDAPSQPRVGGIIFRMSRNSGAERDEIVRLHVGLRAAILKIDIQLEHEVVFLFRRFLEEELFSDDNALCRGVLELDGIALPRHFVFRQHRRGRIIDNRADRQPVWRI